MHAGRRTGAPLHQVRIIVSSRPRTEIPSWRWRLTSDLGPRAQLCAARLHHMQQFIGELCITAYNDGFKPCTAGVTTRRPLATLLIKLIAVQRWTDLAALE
jgi:hypothetical protein